MTHTRQKSAGGANPRADGVSRSASERIYHTLRQEIVSSQLDPQAPLSETRLAERFGVSRTPVREALQRLEQHGLVAESETARFVVAGLTHRDVRESCDLLELLDGYVYSSAVARIAPGQLGELFGCVERMVASAHLDDVDGWNAADRGFHQLVEGAVDNTLAADLSRRLRERVHRFWIESAAQRAHRLESCSREHEEIAVAIRAADTAAIHRLVHTHVTRMRTSLERMLDEAAPVLGRTSRLEWPEAE
jgi:DNA-binding GntR family transcriptional regulator